jgi:hypothetical protein
MKREWFHLLTNVAVIIGVVGVIYELQQAHFLSRMDLMSETHSTVMSRNYQLMGENAAVAITKARADPGTFSIIRLC